MERAASEDDIPTVPAFPVPGVREVAPFFPEPPPRPRSALVIDTAAEGFFAAGLAMNDVGPRESDVGSSENDVGSSENDEELDAWWSAQRRRDLSRYVVAVVVVCLGILGATAARLG